MKQIAFFALALFAFIGMVQLARIFGQEAIAINPTNSTTNQTQFSYHLSTNPVMNKGFGFGAGAPYQQLFWIFGDGNYKWDKGPYYPDDNSTYTFAHGYLAPDAQQFPYETALLVLDRKTDNPPPSRLTPATVSITGTGPGGQDDYISHQYHIPILDFNLHPTERVGLINSHFVDPLPNDPNSGYYFIEDNSRTAFVLAFAPESRGKLLFFYPDQDSGVDEFDNTPVTFKPRYGSVSLSGAVAKWSADQYEKVIPNPRLFHKTLEYALAGEEYRIDITAGGNPKEELRLFHILQAKNIQEDTNYPVMAMLVSDKQDDWNNNGQANFTTGGDNSFASNYVDSSNGEVNGPAGKSYFVDAALINLKGGEPKDPNQLQVTNICRCGANQNDYLVSFELTFCNINDYPTQGANVLIKDNSGLFDCFRLVDASGGDKAIEPMNNQTDGAVAQWPSCPKCTDGSQYANWDATFCVNAYSLAAQTTSKDGDCAIFRFTARTNALGLNELLKENTLTACVQFHEVILKCETVCSGSRRLHCPDVVPRDSSSTAKDVNPKPFTSTAIGCNVWQNRNNPCSADCNCHCQKIICKFTQYIKAFPFAFALLLVVVLGGVWYFLRRRRAKPVE